MQPYVYIQETMRLAKEVAELEAEVKDANDTIHESLNRKRAANVAIREATKRLELAEVKMGDAKRRMTVTADSFQMAAVAAATKARIKKVREAFDRDDSKHKRIAQAACLKKVRDDSKHTRIDWPGDEDDVKKAPDWSDSDEDDDILFDRPSSFKKNHEICLAGKSAECAIVI